MLTVNDIEVADERVFVTGQGLGRAGVFALSEATGTLIEAFVPPLGASPGAAFGAGTYVVEPGTASGLADIAVLNVGARLDYQTPAPPGTYVVCVRGRNDCGPGPASNETVVRVGGPPPAPPTNLQWVVSGRAVTLSWDAPTTGAPPASCRLEAGSAPGLANLATAATTDRTFVTTGVPDGTYYVRVPSVNATGPSEPTLDVIVVIP